MKIEKFEDIQTWQLARELVKETYELTRDKNCSRDYGFKDQIQRSSISIMANIAEGFDSQSDIEFVKFLNYSKRSTSEVQSHLYVALGQEYVIQEKFDELYEKCKEIKRLIGGFIRYLKKT